MIDAALSAPKPHFNEGRTWIFYKICFGLEYARLDSFLSNTVAKLCPMVDAARWFFIRYIDEDGIHIRLRFLVDDDKRREAEGLILKEISRGLDNVTSLPPTEYTPLVSMDESLMEERGPEGQMPSENLPMMQILKAEYEPEFDVYGEYGGAMEIAESHFQISSEIALEIVGKDIAGHEVSRKTLAPLLMQAVIETFEPEEGVGEFLKFYSQYWAGSMTGGAYGPLLNSFQEKAVELKENDIQIFTDRTNLSDAERAILDAWVSELGRAHDEYMKIPSFLSASQNERLLFNFLHLMNNRIGIGPVDESYLATLMLEA